MNYRFRKPETAPTVAVILVALLMAKLGFWQLERLAWKNDLLHAIEEAQSAPPRSLLSYRKEELPKAQWHNVIVTGTLLNDKELYATPRYYKEQMGYAVLTPLAIPTPSGTQYVLVNRGWVAPLWKDPTRRPDGNPAGPVTVEGVIRGNFHQDLFRPDNAPQKNLWFWYDLPAMGKQLNLPLLPVMIDATRVTLAAGTPIKDGPQPFPIEINIRNDHLGYAITWFLLGISAVVIYGCYYLEKKPPPLKSGD